MASSGPTPVDPDGGDGGQRIGHVVLADLTPAHGAEGGVVEVHLEGAAVRVHGRGVPAVTRVHVVWAGAHVAVAEALDGGPAAHGQHLADRVVVGRCHDQPAAGHRPQQVVELGLNGRQIGKDVGVVMLQIAGVADHHQVRRRVELGRVEAFEHLDLGRGELVAHGGIDGLVRARDPVAHFPRELGQAAHERAADAEEVDVAAAHWGGPTAS